MPDTTSAPAERERRAREFHLDQADGTDGDACPPAVNVRPSPNPVKVNQTKSNLWDENTGLA